MGDSTHELVGQCLSGGVRLRALPKALHADACHCGTCRRWDGAPAMTIDCGANVVVAAFGAG